MNCIVSFYLVTHLQMTVQKLRHVCIFQIVEFGIVRFFVLHTNVSYNNKIILYALFNSERNRNSFLPIHTLKCVDLNFTFNSLQESGRNQTGHSLSVGRSLFQQLFTLCTFQRQ